MTEELVEAVYGLKCQIIDDPQTGTPLVVPRASPHGQDTGVSAGCPPGSPGGHPTFGVRQAADRSATGRPLSAFASCGVSTSSAYSSASGPL